MTFLQIGYFGLGHKQRKQILVGVSALCWPIWISRNHIIFDKSLMKTYMHVESHTDVDNECYFSSVKNTPLR
jgi:hypothetical protein